MKRIYQTNFSIARGNCLQAAVASVLGKNSIDDVPRFSPLVWQRAMARYFYEQEKIVCSIEVPNPEAIAKIFKRIAYQGTCLASVKSMVHEEHLHAVVVDIAYGKVTVVHDPNSANAGRASDEYEIFALHLIF